MAIVEMTKRQVIEVLRKEKLTHSVFAADPDGIQATPTPANTPGCSFCAVGQIVRAAMATAAPVSDVFDAAVKSKCYGRPLRGLESAFEFGYKGADDGAEDHDGELGRRAAISYARKNLPPRVCIDIGDAKPRRGMKVVG